MHVLVVDDNDVNRLVVFPLAQQNLRRAVPAQDVTKIQWGKGRHVPTRDNILRQQTVALAASKAEVADVNIAVLANEAEGKRREEWDVYAHT